MSIFLSWSGAYSCKFSKSLKTWLADVFLGAEIWTSVADISAGNQWLPAIHKQLKRTEFGIICVTHSNQLAPWILYEAGALAVTSPTSQVVPLLLDLHMSDLCMPLSQFQAVQACEDGIFKLLQSINGSKAVPQQHSEKSLERAFQRWWPDLSAMLIPPASIYSHENCTIVKPKGRNLSESEISDFHQSVRSTIRSTTNPVIIDLTDVFFVSSSGFGSLLSSYYSALSNNARLVISGASANIREAMSLTGLEQMIPIFESVNDAVANLNQSNKSS